MKILRYSVLLVVCIDYLTEPCYASSLYRGTWKTQDSAFDMTLVINRQGITWTIDGEQVQNVEFEYVAGKLPACVYLTIYSMVRDEERLLCLLLAPGEEGLKLNQMIGVYEDSKLLYMGMTENEQEKGLQRTGISQIRFVKACEYTETCD